MTPSTRIWVCCACWAIFFIVVMTYMLLLLSPGVRDECVGNGVRAYSDRNLWSVSLQLRDDATCKRPA